MDFSSPIRVNGQPGSAIAVGTMRGARLSIGKNGRVHVSWNGSNKATPRGFAAFDSGTPKPFAAPAPPDSNVAKRKHPAIASNESGETIMVWTEGAGWKKGGALAWQIFDKNGNPVGAMGSAQGVPVWGLASVVAETDGSFTIVY
jgi:hypothetical protein